MVVDAVKAKLPKMRERPKVEGNGNGKAKNSLKVEKQYSASENQPRWQKYQGRKLLCKFYYVSKDEHGRIIQKRLHGQKVVKKIAGDIVFYKEGEYYIDFGCVYQGNKMLEVELDVRNSIGVLATIDTAEPVDTADGRIAPDKADAFYTSLQGELFLHNNGIPKLWFLLVLIGMIAATGIAFFGWSSYMGINTKYTADHTYLCTIEPEHIGCPPPKPVTKPGVSTK